MRYLVTGGLGVIGSSIARRLLEAGHEVEIIDACEAPRNQWVSEQLSQYGSGLRIKAGRMERGEGMGVLERVDAVIHAAASTGIPYSVEYPNDDWLSNVEATRVLLQGLKRWPRPTVVLSSIKPYRVPSPDHFPVHGLDENTVLDCDEPYAASKASQSMLCQAYARSYGVPVVTFRCSNLVGAAPCHGKRHGWATWFAISAAIGKPLVVQGSGTQSRDLLYSDDIYSACILALENADRLKGEVFNLGGGEKNRVTVRGVADFLKEHCENVDIISGPSRAMDDEHVFVDTAKLRRAVGWEPEVGALDAVRHVLFWAQKNKAALSKIYEDQ